MCQIVRYVIWERERERERGGGVEDRERELQRWPRMYVMQPIYDLATASCCYSMEYHMTAGCMSYYSVHTPTQSYQLYQVPTNQHSRSHTTPLATVVRLIISRKSLLIHMAQP